MKALALLVGLGMVGIGCVGILAPNELLSIGRQFATTGGLWVAAALRVAIGGLFLSVAQRSRSRVGMSVLGVFLVVAGIATPLFGVESARTWISWLSGQDSVLRFWAGVAVALGVFVMYAVLPRRRALRLASSR